MPRARVGASHDDESGVPAGHEEAVARLQAIPNVGPKMAAELVKLGVRRLEDVAGRDPDRCTTSCAPQTPRGTTLA